MAFGILRSVTILHLPLPLYRKELDGGRVVNFVNFRASFDRTGASRFPVF